MNVAYEKVKFPPQDLSRRAILKGEWTTFKVQINNNLHYVSY